MKLYGKDGEETVIRWFDHAPACKQCREVNLASSATFAYSCAQGGVLLMEEMKRRQAAVEAQKAKEVEAWAKEVEAWAKERKTFVLGKSSHEAVAAVTRYVGE